MGLQSLHPQFKSGWRLQKETNFCLPDKSSFFHVFGRFWAKIALNQGKSHKNRSRSGWKCCPGSIFMPPNSKNAGVLLFVLYCCKKRRKGANREIWTFLPSKPAVRFCKKTWKPCKLRAEARIKSKSYSLTKNNF